MTDRPATPRTIRIARTALRKCGMEIFPPWRNYHPYAGHGFTKETGWSHPQLESKEGSRV
jgi:hypothetical protein